MEASRRQGNEAAELGTEGFSSRRVGATERGAQVAEPHDEEPRPSWRKQVDAGTREAREGAPGVTRPVPVRRPLLSDGRSRAVEGRRSQSLARQAADLTEFELAKRLSPPASGLNHAASQRQSAWTRYQSPTGSQSPRHRSLSPEDPRQDNLDAIRARPMPSNREPEAMEPNEGRLHSFRSDRELDARMGGGSASASQRRSEDTDSMESQPRGSPSGRRRHHPDRSHLDRLQAASTMEDERHTKNSKDREKGCGRGTHTAQDPSSYRSRKGERGSAANGSLSILSDGEQSPPSEGPAEENPYQTRPSFIPPLDQQQLSKRLADALRSHGPQLSAQFSLLGGDSALHAAQEASLPVNGQHSTYNKLLQRFGSQEPPFRNDLYGGGLDLDLYSKLTARRWNSCGSLADSLYPASGSAVPGQGPLGSSLPPSLSSTEYHALMQALSQKQQASELDAVANLTIQAILSGSQNRDSFPRSPGLKRKLAEYHEPGYKRHNSSMLSEAEIYSYGNGQQQVCAECGTTNTPTWRRCGKNLMCNACGLRRARSMKNSRMHTGLEAHLPARNMAPKMYSKEDPDVSQ